MCSYNNILCIQLSGDRTMIVNTDTNEQKTLRSSGHSMIMDDKFVLLRQSEFINSYHLLS